MPASSHLADSRTAGESSLNYGWRRLLACYFLPGLLARPLGGRGRGYIKAFLWLDLALLLANVIVDRGPSEGLRRLPEEMALWPVRQNRLRPRSAGALFAATVVTFALIMPGLKAATERASRYRLGGFLNWTPITVDRARTESTFTRYALTHLLLNITAEECYLRGLLWSRMAWLGKWQPLTSGTAWAIYHLNRPVKDMISDILPAALLASYVRASTGNIYWTAVGHFLSNAYYSRHASLERLDKGAS